jgi:hypothetical protein
MIFYIPESKYIFLQVRATQSLLANSSNVLFFQPKPIDTGIGIRATRFANFRACKNPC